MAMRALFYGLVPLAASINWEKACVQVAPMELEKKDFWPTRWLETIHKSWYIMIHDAWIFSSWYFAFLCATGSQHWQPMVRNWMTCILEFGWVQKWGICTIQKRSKKVSISPVFAYKTYLFIEITEITRHVLSGYMRRPKDCLITAELDSAVQSALPFDGHGAISGQGAKGRR